MNKKMTINKFPYIRVTKFLDINDVLELMNVSKAMRDAVLNYHKVIRMYLHVFHLLMRYIEDLFTQDELIHTNLKTIFFKGNFKFIRQSVNQMISEFKCNEIKLNPHQIVYVIGTFLAKIILKYQNDLILTDNPYILKNYYKPYEKFNLLSLNSFDIDDDSIDFLIITLKILKKYNIINGVSLCNNKFSNEKIGELFEFACDGYIRLFDFSSNKLSIKGIKLIFQKIKEYIDKYPNYKIYAIDLSDCAILDEELQLISYYLSLNYPIERLCLNANKFSNLKPLAEAMLKNTNITELRLTQMDLGEEMNPLFSVLENNSQITRLILDKNKLVTIMPQMIHSISTMSNLIELSLIRNKINDDFGEQLINSLSTHNTNLQMLYLSINSIGIKTCQEISKFLLLDECQLTILELQSNQIDDECLQELITGMKVNQTLSYLEIGYNKINTISGILLGEYLKNNTTLRTLNIKQNYLFNEGCGKILEGLAENNNSNLRSLNLIGNSIDDKVYSSIKNLIDKRKTLSDLIPIRIILDCNLISNETIEKLEALDGLSYGIELSLEGMIIEN